MNQPNKTIILCCDGTNNEPEHPDTNIVRLYRVLQKTDGQIVFYDPGVGTFAQPGLVSPVAKKLSMGLGLAFGAGFTHNLQEAYEFLVQNYRPGDRICLFGFSRGAFTARAIAGMIHLCGIVRPQHLALIPYASRIYTGAKFGAGKKLRQTYSWSDRECRRAEWRQDPSTRPIQFLGLFETVSSVGIFFKRKTLPYTSHNLAVAKVRQALAIDERRAYFQPKAWPHNPFDKKQDVRQVWFAGVHSDVGGGYAPHERQLSRIPLMWMLQQLLPGLDPTQKIVSPDGLVAIRWKQYWSEVLDLDDGRAAGDARFEVEAIRHRSLKGGWWALEGLPMNHEVDRTEWLIPCARARRPYTRDDLIHTSVGERAAASSYALRRKFRGMTEEAWPVWLRGSNIASAAAPDTAPDAGPDAGAGAAASEGCGASADAGAVNPADGTQQAVRRERVAYPQFGTILAATVATVVSAYVFWAIALGLGNSLLALGAKMPSMRPAPWDPEVGNFSSEILSWVGARLAAPLSAWEPMVNAFWKAWDWPLAWIHGTSAVIVGGGADLGPPLRRLGLFILPLIVLQAGGLLMNRISGFDRYRKRVQGHPVYMRASGYSVHDIVRQLYQLRRRKPKDDELPRDRFAATLRLDLAFPLVYATTVYYCLRRSESSLGELPFWILALPAVSAVADWVENMSLLRIIKAYGTLGPAPRYNRAVEHMERECTGTMKLASRATRIKIAAITLASLVLAANAAAPIQALAVAAVGSLVLGLALKGVGALGRALLCLPLGGGGGVAG